MEVRRITDEILTIVRLRVAEIQRQNNRKQSINISVNIYIYIYIYIYLYFTKMESIMSATDLNHE